MADVKEDAASTTEIAAADVIRMRIAVVILNWNTKDFLRQFIPPLLHSLQNVEGAGLIVADNASTDGSMELMEETFPEVRTLRFDKNLGFTGGYNRAFALLDSCEDPPEYFLLINSDIEVTDNWLKPLADWMDSHPECGACAPKLHSWQERERFEYAGAAGGYIDRYGYPFCRGRVLGHVETDRGQYDSPADVFWATGACLMIRSSVYRKLNGLDDRFFAHMEEIDLCWRMQLQGNKVTIVPQSVVYHVGGGTLPASSPFKLFLNYRNNLLMLDNNAAKTFALCYRRKGLDIEKAASKGKKRGSCLIAWRRFLDRLAAMVYLITLDLPAFKAVIKAHKEFSVLKSAVPTEDIVSFLRERQETASVKGIYKKWIIPETIIRGKKIFSFIQDSNFYNNQ